MAKKPTLLQSILGRPSQSYTFPKEERPKAFAEKQYYRTALKRELADAKVPEPGLNTLTRRRTSSTSSPPANDGGSIPAASTPGPNPAPRPIERTYDLTPTQSSSSASTSNSASSATEPTPLTPRSSTESTEEDGASVSDMGDTETLFFTPPSSPPQGPNMSLETISLALPTSLVDDKPKRPPNYSNASLATVTSATTAKDSLSSSASGTRTNSTRPTTPSASEYSPPPYRYAPASTAEEKARRRATYTDEDWSREVLSSSGAKTSEPPSLHSPPASVRGSRSSSLKIERRRTAPAPSTSTSTSKPLSRSNSASTSILPSASYSGSRGGGSSYSNESSAHFYPEPLPHARPSLTALPHPHPASSSPNRSLDHAQTQTHRKRKTPPGSAATSLMMSMSALMEEDEVEGPSALDGRSGAKAVGKAMNPQHAAFLAAGLGVGVGELEGTSASGSWKKKRSRTSSLPSRQNSDSPNHPPPRARSSSRSPSRTSSSPRPKPPRSTTTSSTSHQTVTLPTPLPIPSPPLSGAPSLPSSGTPGFTSLTLPRASYSNSKTLAKIGPRSARIVGGKVDLTRSGVAQTTMCSVEVLRGVAGLPSSSSSPGIPIIGGLVRRLSSSSSRSRPRGRGEAAAAAQGGGGIRDALGLTSHRSPPGYVGKGEVLVQVWAVGLDGVDGKCAFEKAGLATPHAFFPPPSSSAASTRSNSNSNSNSGGARSPEPGYVPGRSFVGRVMESGREVREEVCKRGDWVVGLCEARRGGALKEFVVVERRRVVRIGGFPAPRRVRSLFPPGADVGACEEEGMDVSELALLGVVGVPGRRALKTLPVSGYVQDGGGRRRRRKALVVHGMWGVGAFVARALSGRGYEVHVHARSPHFSRGRGRGGEGERKEGEMERWGREVLGAKEVVWDDGEGVVAVLKRLRMEIESEGRRGEGWDVVVDTEGGREVWEEGRRLLLSGGSSGGQFTTLVGDMPHRAVPSARDHFKASLRGADSSSSPGIEGKRGEEVGYAWVSVAADVDWFGEDVHHSLAAALSMAFEEGVRPSLALPEFDFGGEEGDGEFPFERAPGAFEGLGEGRVAVVRVVE